MATVRYNYAPANPPKLTPQNRARRVELRDLAEEGRISGISDEEGETILDRLEAKYNAMLQMPKA